MIYFGLDFDTPLPPLPPALGVEYVGPRKLLRLIEQHLGLSGYPERNEYLRIEMYRQALQQYVTANTEVFYAQSFAADRFATATVLLEHRDALVAAGWDFKGKELPYRLAEFAAVEAIFQSKAADPVNAIYLVGSADRWQKALLVAATTPLPFDGLTLYEPFEMLPPFIQRLVHVLQAQGIPIVQHNDTPLAVVKEGMLDRFQRYLMGEKMEKGMPLGEKEIIFITARSDADAATFLAQTLVQNPDWRPSFLIPNLRQNLELALVNEGLPPYGILSATLARPSLQVLKLAPAFLWQPVDIFKIMEFVTLPMKPLDRGLALEIARVLAEKPGMFSDQWYGAVLGYLGKENIDEKVKQQYEFWFSRRRYRSDTAAPKRDVIEIYATIQEWAGDYYEQTGSKDGSLLTLGEQARRICDLLETLPEQRITFLELERIVRTIVEPSPAFFAETSTGHYPFFHQPGAAVAPMDELIWWNCLFEDDTPPPDFWQPKEREYLTQRNCAPELPQLQSQRKLLLRMRPILQTRRRLWLFLPEQTGGEKAVHHLIASDIGTLLGDTKAITYHIGVPEQREQLAKLLKLPKIEYLKPRPPSRPSPWLNVPWKTSEDTREETPTGLESLFYYPHRWFFRQKMGIYPSNLLSVTRDNTLLGNLSHRFFELLLADPTFPTMGKNEISQWIEATSEDLLKKEGATLLLYGREPERKVFLQKVKSAAWNLISMLRSNDWTVLATEKALEGHFVGMPVRGKADLVLQRGNELAIIDLKWGGLTKRKELIKNEEDLQLVLYAHLLPPEGQWPHTAYFILETGKLVARNNVAFKEATLAGKGQDDHAEVCQRIFERMEKTFAWRLEQLQNGLLEIRTERTSNELEEIHAAFLADLLEMKREDARWDDYRTLIDFMG